MHRIPPRSTPQAALVLIRFFRPANLPAIVVALLLALGVGFSPGQASEERPEADEGRFLSRVRQLTFEGKRAGEGYYAPDGKKLVFQSERDPANPFYQIFELDLESGDVRRVSPGTGKTTCAFIRPGDGDVLFSSTHHDPRSEELQREELEFRASGQERRYAWDYDPEMELYVEDGGQLRRLTNVRGYDAEGSYSPDGNWIVFASNRRAYSEKLTPQQQKQLEVDPAFFIDLYLMRADGSEVRRITEVDGYDGGPFFTADGERIVWRRFREDGLTADIWSARMDGSDARRLTDFKAMSWAPYAHPSGQYVVFTSNKLGFSNFELFVVDMQGQREPVRITYTDGFDGLPVPTPDGKGLTWTTNRGGSSQLFTARWNHEAVIQALATAPARGGASTVADAPGAASRSKTQANGSTATAGAPGKMDALIDQVTYLASPELAGRMTGSPGAKAAADYIIEQFQRVGVQPHPAVGDFRHGFEFTAGMNDTGSELRVDGKRFKGEKRVQAFSFSDTGTIEGEVVFAGYGLVVPDEKDFGYDSYHGLDLQDKIVLALRYFPEDADQETRGILSRYSGLRYKAMQARQRGAKAMLIVTGPRSPNAGETVPMTFDAALSGSGILAASIDADIAARIFKHPEGLSLEQMQESLDSANPHVSGFEIPDVKVAITTAVARDRKRGHNVIGYLPGSDPAAERRAPLVIGAHYDHLGHGRGGNSLAKKNEKDQAHLGADDNASGVAAVLQIAEALASRERRRPVLFALWSGEEMGLLGSTAFVKELDDMGIAPAAYINFDMVGRLRDDRLSLQAAGSSAIWPRLIEQANVVHGFDLNVQEDPYLPTDSAPFYQAKTPTLNFFTGSHEDYHRPSDTVDKLNVEGLERIAAMGALLARKVIALEDDPAYVEVEREREEGAGRASLRAYTGTIPDYTAEMEGLLLSGVVGGGPADEAGLQSGDVIVEFGGQTITNIYDYTYALDAVKIGEALEVVVLRGGQRHKFTLTPTARR